MKISEQELQARVDDLPQEMSPERDLWSGIERAIQSKAQEPDSSNKKLVMPLAWAASVVAAVLLTWVSFTPNSGVEQSQSLVAVMQDSFEQQKQTLLVSFGRPDISKLPPAMQEELSKLASARASIEKALRDDPDNADLLNLLRWTQQQELDFIEQLYRPQWQSI